MKLGEEECEVCQLHISHLKEEHMLNETEHAQLTDGTKNKKIFPNCAKSEAFQKHKETAAESRSSYQNEKVRVVPSNEMIVSVDMQKGIMLPRLPSLKQAIFCKRLALFNKTFAPTGKSEMKPVGVLWHEPIKGRSTEDVARTFIFFIHNFGDCENFAFWTDNCSGQNKNWFLYALLVNEANCINGAVNEIVIKYFEPCHTFMLADSFHHKFEQDIKKKKKRAEDFQDFVDLVNACGKSFVMNY